jgi:hypothetical protein
MLRGIDEAITCNGASLESANYSASKSGFRTPLETAIKKM